MDNDIERPIFVPLDIEDGIDYDVRKLTDIIRENGYTNSPSDGDWYDEIYVEGFHLKG